MEILVVFGVGLGNLGRFARKRVKAVAWVDQLNAILSDDSSPINVLATFGHTGNFVVESDASRELVRERFEIALRAACVVLDMVELQKIIVAISALPKMAPSHFRYTGGAAILVSGYRSRELPNSKRLAKYKPFSSRVVLVLKKDAVTASGILDRNRRSGGWGAISGELRNLIGGQWTGRSERTLTGVLRKAVEAREC